MSPSETTERSPLLGQLDHSRKVLVNGQINAGGESGGSDYSPSHNEQPSNARLALIMGSIWVRIPEFCDKELDADYGRLV